MPAECVKWGPVIETPLSDLLRMMKCAAKAERRMPFDRLSTGDSC